MVHSAAAVEAAVQAPLRQDNSGGFPEWPGAVETPDWREAAARPCSEVRAVRVALCNLSQIRFPSTLRSPSMVVPVEMEAMPARQVLVAQAVRADLEVLPAPQARELLLVSQVVRAESAELLRTVVWPVCPGRAGAEDLAVICSFKQKTAL